MGNGNHVHVGVDPTDGSAIAHGVRGNGGCKRSTDEVAIVTGASPSWFERPNNVRGMIVALVAACVLLALSDFFYSNPHPHFGIETSFAFQAWLGFVAFVVIVFLGRLLRFLIERPEGYYESVEDGPIPGQRPDGGGSE